MNYKKCPKCKLNYINENESLCLFCIDENSKEKTTNKTVTDDFSCIVQGLIYGTNSKKIYEKFCDTLGWDKNQITQFGWQTPLYAKNCDTNRENDVWFIYYPNYNLEKLDLVVEDLHVANVITNDGNKIIEVVNAEIGKSNNANRITFVKTKQGYEFFGVYKIIQNGTTRIYQRISDRYPF